MPDHGQLSPRSAQHTPSPDHDQPSKQLAQLKHSRDQGRQSQLSSPRPTYPVVSPANG